MTTDSKRNSIYLVLACALLTDIVDAVAVQASGTESSYFAEVTGSAQMMRSEGKPVSTHPPAHAHAQAARPASHSVAAGKKATPVKKVKLELFYESRCPDCVEFMNSSVAKIWRDKELNPHIDLVLNPYGNAMTVPMAKISEGYKFWHPDRKNEWKDVFICQHGDEECFADTLQACAIAKLPQEQHVELIFCMEGKAPYETPERSSYECMEDLKINKEDMRTCANGKEGNQILFEAGVRTSKVPGRDGTPWILIDGKHLENPEHLLREVCAKVGPGMKACKAFERKPEDSKSEKKDDTEQDPNWFRVLGKVNNVDKNLVMMSPPEKA